MPGRPGKEILVMGGGKFVRCNANAGHITSAFANCIGGRAERLFRGEWRLHVDNVTYVTYMSTHVTAKSN